MFEAGSRIFSLPPSQYKKPTRRKRDKRRPPEPLYIALMDMDLSWYADEVSRIIELWNAGAPLEHMAKEMARDPDEVGILLLDLARGKRIENREGGVFGNAWI